MNWRAVDVGYGFIKALDDRKKEIFPAILGAYEKINYSSGMETQDFKSQMVINHAELGTYFIGESARRQSEPFATLEKDRIVEKEGKLHLLAALGLLQRQKTEEINLVVGLPVLYHKKLMVAAYEEMISGNHQFQFWRPDGSILDYCNFTVDKVKVIPQPMGCIFSQIINDKGELINEQLAAGRIGAIVIGFNTVEICRCDNLDFIQNKSDSYPGLGMFSILDAFQKEVSEQLGVDIPDKDIESCIYKDFIIIRGKEHSLVEIKNMVFSNALEKIISKAKGKWLDMNFMDRIYIAGGPAEIIGKKIAQMIGSHAEVPNDPIWSVAEGYGRLAKYSWK